MASITAGVVCLTASGGLSVSADVVLTTVDLTPEQTLALYGSTIQGYYYKNDNTWGNMQFTYYCNSLDFNPASPAKTIITGTSFSVNNYPAGYASATDYVEDCLAGMVHLYYIGYVDDMPNMTSSHSIRFMLTPSINIQGVAYFRQNVGMSRQSDWSTNAPYIQDCSVSCNFSYSATPVSSYAFGWDNYALANWRTVYGYDYLGQAMDTRFTCIDVYGQHTDHNGNDEIFTVSGQTYQFGYANSVTNPDYTQTDPTYRRFIILSVSCPRVSDGYIIPSPDGTTPDYSGQLNDIAGNIADNTTLLQQILAKLDLIYQSMQSNGLPNPSLTPAQTMPRDLQQYYTGVATGAPSVSAVNGAIGGASDFIPFSDVLSSSGLGSLLGVLAGLCCAGWVLTRGRTG